MRRISLVAISFCFLLICSCNTNKSIDNLSNNGILLINNDGKPVEYKSVTNETSISVIDFNHSTIATKYSLIIMPADFIRTIDGKKIRELIDKGTIFYVQTNHCMSTLTAMYSLINEKNAITINTHQINEIGTFIVYDNGKYVPGIIGEAEVSPMNQMNINNTISSNPEEDKTFNANLLINYIENNYRGKSELSDSNVQYDRSCIFFTNLINESGSIGTLSFCEEISGEKTTFESGTAKSVGDVTTKILIDIENNYYLDSFDAGLNCDLSYMDCIGQSYLNNNDNLRITNDFVSAKYKFWRCEILTNANHSFDIEPTIRLVNNNSANNKSGVTTTLENISLKSRSFGSIGYKLPDKVGISVYWIP